ncbi:hypothetical protein BC826DRAFT_710223 [Russula brevipes]|nr:hypothetical protein BC826DRAFT_710223 [Russula brevipes]
MIYFISTTLHYHEHSPGILSRNDFLTNMCLLVLLVTARPDLYVNMEERRGGRKAHNLWHVVCPILCRRRVASLYYCRVRGNCPQTVCHQANRLFNEPLQPNPKICPASSHLLAQYHHQIPMFIFPPPCQPDRWPLERPADGGKFDTLPGGVRWTAGFMPGDGQHAHRRRPPGNI